MPATILLMKYGKLHRQTLRRLGYVALVAAPAFFLGVLLVKYAVNVPFWDQWELVTLFQNWHFGQLSFADFFAQHNEHRVLFPRLIMFALAVATGWNILYEIAVNLVLALLIFWFLWLILQRTFVTTRMRVIAAAAVSLVVFSPIQLENWLWGWQIQWYLNVLGLVVSVWALYVWRTVTWVKFVVAIAAAIIATYSLASGFFVWLVCIPLIWFNKDLRHLLWLWLGVAVVAVGSHYIGYIDPAHHPSKLIFLKEPFNFLLYSLVYIVRPLSVDYMVSIPVFVAYAVVYVGALGYIAKRYIEQITIALLPWLSLSLYGLCAAATTAISRLGFGIEQAYSSRYSTLSNLILIGGVVLLCKIIERERSEGGSKVHRAAIFLFAATIVIVVANFGKGAIQMHNRHTELVKMQHCARTATSSKDDCLLLLYPDKDTVWPRLEYLRSIHWGGL